MLVQPFLLVHRQERERKSIIMNIKGSPMFHKKKGRALLSMKR